MILFLLQIVYCYPYMRPNYPNYIDLYNGSVTSVYGNYTENLIGSFKALNLKYTKQGSSPYLSIGIKDNTWTAKIYNKTINTSEPPQDLMRNITVTYGLYDGNFTTSPAQYWICSGHYFPNVSRGLAYCKYQDGFVFDVKPNYDINETAKYILNLSEPWPQKDNFTIKDEQQKIEQGNAGKLNVKRSDSMVYFTMSTYNRRNIKRYQYPFDNSYRYSWRQEGVYSQDKQYMIVPLMNLAIIGQDVGYKFNVSAPVGNSAAQQKSALTFAAIVVAVQIGVTLSNIKLSVSTDTINRFKQLGATSVIFLLNAQYLEAILFISSPSMLSGVTNLMAFLSILNIGSLFPLMLRFSILLSQQLNQQILQNYMRSVFRLIGLLLCSILPAILIVILAYFVPLIVTFILVVILAQHTFVYVITVIVKGHKPTYPLYYIILNTADKALVLTYIFGLDNAYGVEYKLGYLITVNSSLGLSLLLYILQMCIGPRFGFKCFKRTSTYDYATEPLHEHFIQQLNPQPTPQNFIEPVIVCYMGDSEESVCANPTHKHSSVFQGNDVKYLQQIKEFSNVITQLGSKIKNPETQTMCFSYVEAENIREQTCSICFDELRLLQANNGLYRKLFDQNTAIGRLENALNLQKSNVEETYVTPCGHVFHKSCLRHWMEENGHCPIDRSELPPALD